jgi:hypothetical protein
VFSVEDWLSTKEGAGSLALVFLEGSERVHLGLRGEDLESHGDKCWWSWKLCSKVPLYHPGINVACFGT